jgi:hypothetical protein
LLTHTRCASQQAGEDSDDDGGNGACGGGARARGEGATGDSWSCLPEGLRVSTGGLGVTGVIVGGLDAAGQAVFDAARALSGGAARSGEDAAAAASAAAAVLSSALAAAAPAAAQARDVPRISRTRRGRTTNRWLCPV